MSDRYIQENTQEKPPKRKFWQNLLIMDSGDLKRLLSLSSMMLSFVLIIVYIVFYLLLMPLLDRIFGQGPVILANLLESLIPALAATATIMLTWPVFRDKRVLPAAYLWMTFFILLLFITVLIALRNDTSARDAFLYTCLWEVLPSLIIGNLAVWLKYSSFVNL